MYGGSQNADGALKIIGVAGVKIELLPCTQVFFRHLQNSTSWNKASYRMKPSGNWSGGKFSASFGFFFK
jgi:hypothetical protein